MPAALFEPLIYGVDVMLRRFERLVGIHPLLDAKRGYCGGTRMINPQKNLVNLPGVTEQIASHYRTDADERSIHIFVDVAPDALVIGDSSNLQYVLEELFIAALESTPNNGCVAISGRLSNGVVTFSLCSYNLDPWPEEGNHFPDCGEPVGEKALAARLSIRSVGNVLRAHGGRMEVKTRPGDLLRVVIRLPVAWKMPPDEFQSNTGPCG